MMLQTRGINFGLEVIVIGDLNINMKKPYNSDNPINEMCNFLNMENLINEATRETNTSSTIIDLILTTMPNSHIVSDIIKTSISDHYLVYTLLRYKKSAKGHRNIQVRSYKNFNEQSFFSDLQITLESFTLNPPNTTKFCMVQMENCLTILLIYMHLYAVTELKVETKPWITYEAIQLMYERDHAHNKWTKTKEQVWLDKYKSLRNLVTSKITYDKSEYFRNGIDNANGNPRKVWNIIKHALGTNRPSKTETISQLSPDTLNNVFINIGPFLAKKFPKNKPNWILPTSIHTFKFCEISKTFILKYLNSLTYKSNLDINLIDSKLLKIAANVITDSIHSLLNLSLSVGYFPSEWKIAKVTPIFKGKGSKTSEMNYRPISVLPHVAKIMEKAIQIQLSNYLTD